jgi:DNA mismatch repair protein MutS
MGLFGDDKYTPSMRQYFSIKAKYPDAILLFRMGDFYEMFGADAEEAASILNIALTTREKGREEPIPMAGVPYHSVTPYLRKLLDAGKKVAICEQIGDPKKTKGIVERKVVRVLTPGTLLEDEFLEEGGRNYLAAISLQDGKIGLALVELSMGAFLATEIDDMPSERNVLLDEFRRFNVKEVLVPENANIKWFENMGLAVEKYRLVPGDEFLAKALLENRLGIADLQTHEISQHPSAVLASFHILKYLESSNPGSLSAIRRLIVYRSDDFLVLDEATLKNLEIIANMRNGGREHTLLWVLDKTRTPLGRRTLTEWLIRPLTNRAHIVKRHDAVDELKSESLIRESIRDLLKGISDISRIVGRIASQLAHPRDLVAIRDALERLPEIKNLLGRLKSQLLDEINNQLNPNDDVVELLNRAIIADPSQSVSPLIFKKGYSQELDELYKLTTDSRSILVEIQEKERQKSGINKLKVAYNKVYGYYIEIPKAQAVKVPDHYFRKQTLLNCERFITQELKDLESKILGAEERSDELAKELWRLLLEDLSKFAESLISTANAIGRLDVIISFAQSAAEEGYIRAEILDDSRIELTESRHPVLEKVMGRDKFVPNDASFDRLEAQMNVLTGPNMAGKSTYMRQIALAIIMNQVGAFVPAKTAKLSIFDRIFTRVGATDDLALGQSTFMVEMTQTAQILASATPRSFIVLDEIGRGTSTFDGLALAWSIAEYIHNSPTLGSITIFATHYHQLTRLSEFLPRVRNLRVMLKEEGTDVIFLRKVLPGRAQKSYGIQVARLAGLPDEVLNRAREIFSAIEKERFEINIIGRTKGDLPLFDMPEKESEQQELFE